MKIDYSLTLESWNEAWISFIIYQYFTNKSEIISRDFVQLIELLLLFC